MGAADLDGLGVTVIKGIKVGKTKTDRGQGLRDFALVLLAHYSDLHTAKTDTFFILTFFNLLHPTRVR
jgi:hypothetical protein